MGTITSDLLCCIVLLNSLSSHFPHACSIIFHDITVSTEYVPYTFKDIHLFLENEQTLLETDACNSGSSSLALVATSKLFKLSGTAFCSNCKRASHITEYCISAGGGMEGKTIEESKAA